MPLERLLPLLGVLIGSLVTTAVNLATAVMRNRRDDLVHKRDRLEHLSVCVGRLRDVYSRISFEVAESYRRSADDAPRGDLHLAHALIGETSNLYAEVRMRGGRFDSGAC